MSDKINSSYLFNLDEASVAQARRLRDDLVAAVRSGELTVVLNGVDMNDKAGGKLISALVEGLGKGKVTAFTRAKFGPSAHTVELPGIVPGGKRDCRRRRLRGFEDWAQSVAESCYANSVGCRRSRGQALTISPG